MNLRRLALAAVAVVAAGSIAACGGGGDDKPDESLTPTARGPQNVAGQSTCVFIDSPAECKDSGVPEDRWFKAPDAEPRAVDGDNDGSDFLAQVFLFQLMYHSWFASPAYVDRYVVVEHRDGYRSRWSSFNSRYADRERASQGRATYRTGGGQTVTGDKVDSKRFAPPAPRNGGGDRGKAVCNAFTVAVLGKGGAAPAPPAPRPVAPAPRPVAPAPKAPAPAKPGAGVGGDRGKGGAGQHGC